jgi:hypothetical protein
LALQIAPEKKDRLKVLLKRRPAFRLHLKTIGVILMNKAARFLSYVEIKTKITSVFPFLMPLAFLYSSG